MDSAVLKGKISFFMRNVNMYIELAKRISEFRKTNLSHYLPEIIKRKEKNL